MTATEQCLRLDSSRYCQARNTLGRAFFDYPLMVYALGNDRKRAPAVTFLYGAFLADCFRWGEVYTTPEVDGVCCWLMGDKAIPTFWRQVRCGLLQTPFRFGVTGFRRLIAYDEVARRMHHQYAPMPHWYLAVIGVDPGRQGQGVGSGLMRPMLARADAAGMHCWLDTHREQNVKLYEKHGFEVSERADLPGHPLPVWGMLRQPR